MGYRVIWREWSSHQIVRAKEKPPAAVVVDLSRSPSRGRDVAIAMRSHRAMLAVPFALVDGSPEAAASVQRFLPDAITTEWERMKTALRGALKRPPAGARLLSVFAAYEKTPLARKLGIKPGGVVALRNAPPGFDRTLGDLPEGARIETTGKARDLTLWFVDTSTRLAREIASMKPHAKGGGLWILWQKNAPADGGARLTQPIIRKAALDCGIVDFKIAKIDDHWAGMRFTLRKAKD